MLVSQVDLMIKTGLEHLKDIFAAIDARLRQRGLDVAGVIKMQIPASYSGSGNPPIQSPYETALTLGPKTHKVLQVAGSRNAALIAGDPIKVSTDANDNRVVDGKYVDAGQGVTDADYLMGLRPVQPGNFLLLSEDSEVSTNSATFQEFTDKRFHVDRKGLYRLKCDLSRDGGTAEARLVRKLRDGTVVVVTGLASLAAGGVHPTYGATQIVDMTITSGWDDILYFQLRNQSASILAYAKNVRLYYADAVNSIVPYDAALS
jgi:hypothetical protein